MKNDADNRKQSVAYSTPEIARYFRAHRIKWLELYESERTMLRRLNPSADMRVLDVGCGCGGLGLILADQFGVADYTGIEINHEAVKVAREMNTQARFWDADFLTFSSAEVPEENYDMVVSLSCIDWNVGFDVALPKAYRYVRPGGYFLASFRLTGAETVDDIKKSYQYINYNGEQDGEKAAYVVLNAAELLGRLKELAPESICGFGYWGKPSTTAVTPFQSLCFAVFLVRKATTADRPDEIKLDLQLPPELMPVEMK